MVIKRGDTHPPFKATLSDAAGAANLTGATVKLILKTKGATPTIVVNAACVITDALQGKVQYNWIAADTAAVNSLDGECEVTWADGKITTFPNEGYFAVDIVADLG